MQTYDENQKVLVMCDGSWRPGAVVADDGLTDLIEVRVAFSNNNIRFWVKREMVADPIKSTYGKGGLPELPCIVPGPRKSAKRIEPPVLRDNWQLIAECVALKMTHGETVARRLLFAVVDEMRGQN